MARAWVGTASYRSSQAINEHLKLLRAQGTAIRKLIKVCNRELASLVPPSARGPETQFSLGQNSLLAGFTWDSDDIQDAAGVKLFEPMPSSDPVWMDGVWPVLDRLMNELKQLAQRTWEQTPDLYCDLAWSEMLWRGQKRTNQFAFTAEVVRGTYTCPDCGGSIDDRPGLQSPFGWVHCPKDDNIFAEVPWQRPLDR